MNLSNAQKQDLADEINDYKRKIEKLENQLLALQIQSNDFIGSLETKTFQFQHAVNRITGEK